MIAHDSVNIAARLVAMAESQPEATAVLCPAGRRTGRVPRYTRWSFRELNENSDALARGLGLVGVRRGIRTVLMVKPSLEFFALTFALFKAGAVPVLIDPGMGVKNIGKCLDDAAPEAFIGIPRAQVARQVLGWGKRSIRVSVTVQRAPWIRLNLLNPRRKSDSAAHDNSPPWEGGVRGGGEWTGSRSTALRAARSLALGPCWPFEGIGLDRIWAAGNSNDPFPIAPTEPDEMAAILFTSGSTGPPKGAVYTHAMFSAQVEILRSQYGIEPGEIDLCTFPLFALFAPALGMTAIIPKMDATRPAHVDPTQITSPIESFGVTNLFGSPALLKRVGWYAAERNIKLPSLRRVVSAGAPVPAKVIETFSQALTPDTQIFTPYGATESLPVASIGSHEILSETRQATDQGAGVCVGRVSEGMRVEIIRISDDPIAEWSDDLLEPNGTIGEITVQGPVVSREYIHRPEATALAKIADPNGGFWHRMGDVGYRDSLGRIWFCGRKSHRVITANGTLFTIPCEAVFNTHPSVVRTALVGVGQPGAKTPVLCVELLGKSPKSGERARLINELRELGDRFPHTREIQTFLFHASFPVDIRHNSKIFREKLAAWAARKLR